MSDGLDYEKVEVPCPRCKRRIAAPLGRIRRGLPIGCWSCGNMFTADPAPIEQTLKETSTWLNRLKARPDDG